MVSSWVQGEGRAPSCPQGADSASRDRPCAQLRRESRGEEQAPAPVRGSRAPSRAGVPAPPGTHWAPGHPPGWDWHRVLCLAAMTTEGKNG